MYYITLFYLLQTTFIDFADTIFYSTSDPVFYFRSVP